MLSFYFQNDVQLFQHMCFFSLSFNKAQFSRHSIYDPQKEREPSSFGVTMLWLKIKDSFQLLWLAEIPNNYAFYFIEMHDIEWFGKNCQCFLVKDHEEHTCGWTSWIYYSLHQGRTHHGEPCGISVRCSIKSYIKIWVCVRRFDRGFKEVEPCSML